MVQPQEPGAAEEILKAQKEFETKANKEQCKLPAQMIAAAQAKLDNFLVLKSDLGNKMAKIHEQIEDVRTIVKQNTRSDGHKDGLLTRDESLYLQCVDIDKLGQLLGEDEAHWAENIQLITRKADAIKDEISALINKQQLELAAMMNVSMSLYDRNIAVAPRYTLRKLPMWADDTVNETNVDFEWPTQDIFNSWPADVQLKSIEFKTWGNDKSVISFVQCATTNNVWSPEFVHFQKQQQHFNAKVIDLSRLQKRVAAVQGRINGGGPNRVTFLDSDDNELAKYDAKNEVRSGALHHIGENEQLIGVYGVKDVKSNKLRALGFIVKVKNE